MVKVDVDVIARVKRGLIAIALGRMIGIGLRVS